MKTVIDKIISTKMRVIALLFICSLFLNACISKNENSSLNPLEGTWKLISGTSIKGLDTLVTDYTQNQEMIKIINDTHFSFLRHDLNKGLDSNAVFVAGGGRYTLKGNLYTEYLDYFNSREWEGNSFELEFNISGDTLITSGREKVEELNIDYINIEKYIKVISKD
ncbi:hypothetical protein SAMN06298216_3406 [Spirosomataceae bacterium TFI 002]|nr:hypothetical protein SAMN06298216_3406 [Spirosomataceae bacterium TFI 002]